MIGAKKGFLGFGKQSGQPQWTANEFKVIQNIKNQATLN